MRKFAEMVLKYRTIVIALTLGVTIFFGYGATKVELNTDIISDLKHDPVVDLYNRIGDEYGGNTLSLTVLEADEIFTTETLTVISELTEAYKQIPEISSVMSLTDILDIGKSEYGLEIRKLINKNNIPQDPEELARLKAYTLNKRMYAGKFISEDGKYTLLMCRLKGDADKEAVAHEVKTITEVHKGSYQVYYSGLPSQMLEIGELMVGDLQILLPTERIPLLATALSEVMIPIFLAGLTTLIGFLAFSGSYLTSVTDFGLFTAFGVGSAMLLAVTFLPAVMSMHLIDKDGDVKERTSEMFERAKEDARLVRFLSPADQKGISFLSLPDDKMYLYLPAFKKIRTIASHVKNESFAGTDMSYDDISTLGYAKDYDPTLLETTDDLYILELTPKSGTEKDYSKLVMSIRKDNFYPVKTEYYDQGGTLVKVMERRQIEQIDGYWIAKETEMTDVRKEHSTVSIVDSVEFDTNLPDEVFSQRNLKRTR